MFPVWTVLLLLVVVDHFCHGHVSLIFPPARYPPLDFLDNGRTAEPCGVPKSSQAQYTNLISGQTYEIVWHLGYAHKGGFQIDLLDSSGKLIKLLTPNGFVGNEPMNETTQTYTLTIPKDLQPCSQCILRLQRNAEEWSGYKFWSCSDVNIITPTGSIQPCFGTINGQTCSCTNYRSGQYCQFQDECAADADCGNINQGKCMDLKTTGYPKKVCYCTAPYFGKHCEKKFEPKSDEMKQNCFNYKFNQPNLSASPGTVGAQNLQSQFPSKGLYNPQCYHKETVDDNHFFYWRFVGDEVEMIMDYPGTSWIGVGWRPDYLNGRCQDFPFRSEDVKPHPEAELPRKIHKRDNSRTSGHAAGTTVAIPHPEPSGEPKPSGEGAKHSGEGTKPQAEPHPEPEGPGPMHPMDCTDIVVGSAQGKLTRAADMYTRDRSTPLDDTIYKGKDDLSAVFGAEVDGRTIIMFRKAVKASDQSDHELSGDMRMIWARGQNASEKQSVGHPEFYEPDVLKYHGGNRGSFLVSFTSGANNQTTFVPNIVHGRGTTPLGTNISDFNLLPTRANGGHPSGTNAAQSGGDNMNKQKSPGGGAVSFCQISLFLLVSSVFVLFIGN